jgi:hypothetical protein
VDGDLYFLGLYKTKAEAERAFDDIMGKCAQNTLIPLFPKLYEAIIPIREAKTMATAMSDDHHDPAEEISEVQQGTNLTFFPQFESSFFLTCFHRSRYSHRS